MATAIAARYAQLLAAPLKEPAPEPPAAPVAPAEPPVDVVAELAAATGEPADAVADALGAQPPSLAVATALTAVALAAASADADDAALGRALYAALQTEWQPRVARIAERLRGVRLGGEATTAAAAPMRALPDMMYGQTSASLYPLQSISLLGRWAGRDPRSPEVRQEATALLAIATNARDELTRVAESLRATVEAADAERPAAAAASVDAPGGPLGYVSTLVASTIFSLLDPTAVFDLGRVSTVFARTLRTAPTGLAWTSYMHAYPDIAAELGWQLVAELQTRTELEVLSALDVRREAQRLLDARPTDAGAAALLRSALDKADQVVRLASANQPELVPLLAGRIGGAELWKRVQFNRRVQALRAATAALAVNEQIRRRVLVGTAAEHYQRVVELFGSPWTDAPAATRRTGPYVGSYYYTSYDMRSRQSREAATQRADSTLSAPLVKYFRLAGNDSRGFLAQPLLSPAAFEYDASRSVLFFRSRIRSVDQAVGSSQMAVEYYCERAVTPNRLHGVESLGESRIVGADQRIGVCVYHGTTPEDDCGLPQFIKETLISVDSVIIGTMMRRLLTARSGIAYLYETFVGQLNQRDATGMPVVNELHENVLAYLRDLVLMSPPFTAPGAPLLSFDDWRTGARASGATESMIALSYRLFRYLMASVAYGAAVMPGPTVGKVQHSTPLPIAHVRAYGSLFELPQLTDALANVLEPPAAERQAIAWRALEASDDLRQARTRLGVAAPTVGSETPIDRLTPMN